MSFLSCNKDIENVQLEGYVFEGEKKQPVPKFRLYIRNYFYEGGDYDGYMPSELYTVLTNRKGYYSIKLKRSALIQIDTVKDGSSPLFKDKYIYKEKERIDFYLKRK